MELKVGDKLTRNNVSVLRIMAIAEGYALCRYKGAFPHARSLKDFEGRYCNPCGISYEKRDEFCGRCSVATTSWVKI